MLAELAAIGVESPLAVVTVGWNFAKTVWEPTRSDIGGGITSLARGAIRATPKERVARFAARHPEVARLFEERYDPLLDPADLARLPAGTLGHEYARFIHSNGIDPLQTQLGLGEATHPLHYSVKRAYKLHDLMHVLLGCDASVFGEVRIVSWSIGQATRAGGAEMRAPDLALSVLLLHLTLRFPDRVPEAIRLSAEWLERGARHPDHVTFRFEDWLDEPVASVLARFEATGRA